MQETSDIDKINQTINNDSIPDNITNEGENNAEIINEENDNGDDDYSDDDIYYESDENEKSYEIVKNAVILNKYFYGEILEGSLPFCDEIDTLIMNKSYNEHINYGVITKNYKKVIMGSNYKVDISTSLPLSVTQLEIGENYTGPIPKHLTCLVMPFSTLERDIYPHPHKLAPTVLIKDINIPYVYGFEKKLSEDKILSKNFYSNNFLDVNGCISERSLVKLAGPDEYDIFYTCITLSFMALLFLLFFFLLSLFIHNIPPACEEHGGAIFVNSECQLTIKELRIMKKIGNNFIGINPDLSAVVMEGNFGKMFNNYYLPINVKKIFMDSVGNYIPHIPNTVNELYLSVDAYKKLQLVDVGNYSYDLFVYSRTNSEINNIVPHLSNTLGDVVDFFEFGNFFARKIMHNPVYEKIKNISSISENYATRSDCSLDYIVEYVYSKLLDREDKNISNAFSTKIKISECSVRSIESAINIVRDNSFLNIKAEGHTVYISV